MNRFYFCAKKEDIMGANIFVGILTAIVIFTGISAWHMENISDKNNENNKKDEK